nr:MAG TPA: hypothetical protein [Crassvirales sp.]
MIYSINYISKYCFTFTTSSNTFYKYHILILRKNIVCPKVLK